MITIIHVRVILASLSMILKLTKQLLKTLSKDLQQLILSLETVGRTPVHLAKRSWPINKEDLLSALRLIRSGLRLEISRFADVKSAASLDLMVIKLYVCYKQERNRLLRENKALENLKQTLKNKQQLPGLSPKPTKNIAHSQISRKLY